MINFGPLAAEHDPDIGIYYHVTSQCKRLIDRKNTATEFIISSRPGAGKTAFVGKLSSNDKSSTAVVIQPENTQLLTEDDELNIEDHKILVEHELLAALLAELHNRGVLKGEGEKEWKTFFSTLAKKAGRFVGDRFQGLSILGCGFTLKPSERLEYLAVLKRSNSIKQLRDIFGRTLDHVKPLVVLDNPEGLVTKGMDEISVTNSKKLGAFLSVLSKVHGLGCPTAVFIKEYVLQSVIEHYVDVVHFIDNIASIQWTRDDLSELVTLRIKKRLKSQWSAIFSMTEEALADYLFPLLINGPRDLLLVLNTAGKQNGKISKELLRSAIPALHKQRLADCERQYGRRWPRISDVVKAILTGIPEGKRKQVMVKEELTELIRQEHQKPRSNLHALRKIDWVNTVMWGEPTIDAKLYLCGCVGYEVNGKTTYTWMGGTVADYEQSNRVFVSPLFHES